MRRDVDVAVNGSWNRSPENVVAGKEMCVSAASTPAAAGKPSVSVAENVAERHVAAFAVAITGLVRPAGAGGQAAPVDSSVTLPALAFACTTTVSFDDERRARGGAVREECGDDERVRIRIAIGEHESSGVGRRAVVGEHFLEHEALPRLGSASQSSP